MTTHEVLVQARNNLERLGWQRRYSREPGPNCALGHLDRAGWHEYAPGDPPYEALLTAAGSPGTIGEWNDSRGSVEEVLAAFDEAIAATAPPPADPFPSEQPSELVTV